MNIRKATQALRTASDPCPKCGSTKAYHGFAKIECPTKGCDNFTQQQHDAVKGGMKPTPAPPVATKLGGADVHECDNCRQHWRGDQLKPAKNLGQRVDPGGPTPSGECPDCGSLAYPQVGCRRCGTPLENGMCGDETCPFSDYRQHDQRGWVGHPNPPAAAPEYEEDPDTSGDCPDCGGETEHFAGCNAPDALNKNGHPNALTCPRCKGEYIDAAALARHKCTKP
jgi:hypothetical protein